MGKNFLVSLLLSYRILPVLFLLLDGPDLAMTLKVIPKQMKLNCEGKKKVISFYIYHQYHNYSLNINF